MLVDVFLEGDDLFFEESLAVVLGREEKSDHRNCERVKGDSPDHPHQREHDFEIRAGHDVAVADGGQHHEAVVDGRRVDLHVALLGRAEVVQPRSVPKVVIFAQKYEQAGSDVHHQEGHHRHVNRAEQRRLGPDLIAIKFLKLENLQEIYQIEKVGFDDGGEELGKLVQSQQLVDS